MTRGPRARGWRALWIGCALACLPVAGVWGDQEGGRSHELERLRGQIEASRDRVGGHERRERALLEELETLDRSLLRLRRRVRAARADEREAGRSLEAARTRRGHAETRLAATRRAMGARAVALYKAGEAGPLQALFAASTLPELMARAGTLRVLLASDRILIDRHLSLRDSLARAERDAREAKQRRDQAATRLQAELALLQDSRVARRDVLQRVQRDRSEERALLIELERAARALEETLVELEGAGAGPGRSAGDGAAFAARRGRLAAPVDAQISARFGRVVDQEFLTETLRKGIEFGADAGDSVRSCAAGDVRFAGWFRGYGRIVILHHGGPYFTVFGQLDEVFVEVGDAVSEGDTIATVGDTGSLTGPGLYFEIRRGSEPLDPTDWLGEPRLRAGSG